MSRDQVERFTKLLASADPDLDGSESSGHLPSLPSEGDEEGVGIAADRVAEALSAGGGVVKPDNDAKVMELLGVLQEASEEIRNERDVSHQLREEIAELRGQLEKMRTGGEGGGEEAMLKEENARLTSEIVALREENVRVKGLLLPYREKVCELSLTASFAIEQLATFKARVAVANAQQRQQQQQQQQQHQQQHLYVSPPGMGQVQPPPPPPPPPAAPPTSRRSPSSSRAPSRSGNPHPTIQPTRRRHSPSPSPPSPHDRNEQLMERMRRAFAPPPKETMGILVNSMVQELRKVMRERGTELPLERKGDCLYMIGSKKVNLAVSGGKLVVKSGGGHHDFLTFLEKYMNSSLAHRGGLK